MMKRIVYVALWEDPSPLRDDDGNAYLVRGKVRADILYVHRMSPDGRRLLDNGTIVFQDRGVYGRIVHLQPGVWIGAKVGLFNVNPNVAESEGYADFAWFRFE